MCFDKKLNCKIFVKGEGVEYDQLKMILKAGGSIQDCFPPESLAISITDQCPSQCKYCWRYTKSNFCKGLSLSRILSLVDEAASMGIKTFSIEGGGEPLSRKKDLLKIISKVKECGMSCDLISNFVLTDRVFFEAISSLSLDCLLVSIDSPDKSINDLLRGIGVTEIVTKNISLFKSINTDLPLCTLTVLTEINYRDMVNMIQFGIDNSIEKVIFCRLTEGSPLYDELKIKNSENLLQVQEKAMKFARGRIATNLHQFSPDVIKHYNNILPIVHNGIACFEPWYEISIDAKGAVGYCCNSDYSMGNINRRSLEEIWYGKKYNEIRSLWVEKVYVQSCINCDLYFIQRKRETSSFLN